MAYPRKLVEHTILGLYDPLNRASWSNWSGSIFRRRLRQHFRREVETWLDKIQSLRFKPNNRTGSAKFYFDLLFDYPFGGVEVQNMRRIMDLIADNTTMRGPSRRRKRWSNGCGNFTRELAERLHKGEDVLDMIPE